MTIKEQERRGMREREKEVEEGCRMRKRKKGNA